MARAEMTTTEKKQRLCNKDWDILHDLLCNIETSTCYLKINQGCNDAKLACFCASGRSDTLTLYLDSMCSQSLDHQNAFARVLLAKSITSSYNYLLDNGFQFLEKIARSVYFLRPCHQNTVRHRWTIVQTRSSQPRSSSLEHDHISPSFKD